MSTDYRTDLHVLVHELQDAGFTVRDAWLGDDLSGPKSEGDLAFVEVVRLRSRAVQGILDVIDPDRGAEIDYQWRDASSYRHLGGHLAWAVDTAKHRWLPYDVVIWLPKRSLFAAASNLRSAA